MNPNDNTMPISPDSAAPESANTDNNLSMADSLASAEDNLTAAGMAAPAASTSVSLDEISADKPEAIMENPVEEPLVPAGPVPGSIGSATSGAPVAEPTEPAMETPASPFTPFTPAETATTEPATPPYNPFAAQNNVSEPMQPSFQPASPVAPSPKSKGKSPKTAILIIITVLAVAAAAVFGYLFWNLQNNPKIVYVNEGGSSTVVTNLSCAQVVDYSNITGVATPTLRLFSAEFSDDALTSIIANYRMTTVDQVAADNLKVNIESEVNNLGETFTGVYDTAGGVFTATVSAEAPAEEAALTYIYGAGSESTELSLEAIQAQFQNLGYTCIAE